MQNEHPEIPHGCYCYKLLSVDKITGKLKIEICPHWHAKAINAQPGAYCSLIKQYSQHEEANNMLWDQVKECGINEDFDGED